MGVRIANSGRVGAWLDSLLNLTMHSFFSSRTYRTIHDLALEGYTYPVATEASRAGIAAFTRMFFNPDPVTTDRLGEISRKLKEIQAPVSLLYGERDPLLTRLPAYILRDELKGAAEPVFLPDVAHFVPEEAPDVLAETVLQQPAPSPADTDGSMFRIIG
jgi:pimeloyl-ACP methyl ester carboxylesterase